jgi:metal-responsive CopG/Arc/MetJ family transcriptional regulator
MKRTQLYLDEKLASILDAVSRQRRTTISELVRECIREKFGAKQEVDRVSLSRQIAGIWRNRHEVSNTAEYVRMLRRDSRRKRLKLG